MHISHVVMHNSGWSRKKINLYLLKQEIGQTFIWRTGSSNRVAVRDECDWEYQRCSASVWKSVKGCRGPWVLNKISEKSLKHVFSGKHHYTPTAVTLLEIVWPQLNFATHEPMSSHWLRKCKYLVSPKGRNPPSCCKNIAKSGPFLMWCLRAPVWELEFFSSQQIVGGVMYCWAVDQSNAGVSVCSSHSVITSVFHAGLLQVLTLDQIPSLINKSCCIPAPASRKDTCNSVERIE